MESHRKDAQIKCYVASNVSSNSETFQLLLNISVLSCYSHFDIIIKDYYLCINITIKIISLKYTLQNCYLKKKQQFFLFLY